jgi:opacity protein-like surface antigen
MKTPRILPFLTIALIISYLLLTNQSWAGNSYYLGTDYTKSSIKISTTNSALGISASEEAETKSNDYGLRFGYRHKINKYIYIAPELFYQKLDKSSYLYSTTMKAGVSIEDLSLFGSLGYAEINKFNNSAENFGGGLEYKINDNFSVGAEYIGFADVKTSDTKSETRTDKTNKLQTIKFGITYYFHE